MQRLSTSRTADQTAWRILVFRVIFNNSSIQDGLFDISAPNPPASHLKNSVFGEPVSPRPNRLLKNSFSVIPEVLIGESSACEFNNF